MPRYYEGLRTRVLTVRVSLVFKAIHIDLHSCSDNSSSTDTANIFLSHTLASSSVARPSEAVTSTLHQEIQDELIDVALWDQSGPIRSACENAVTRRRRLVAAEQDREREEKKRCMLVTPMRHTDLPPEYSPGLAGERSPDSGYSRARSKSFSF